MTDQTDLQARVNASATSLATSGDYSLPVLRARFVEKLELDGQKLDGNVTGRLLSAKMIRAYDSATSLELELDDHDFRILRSGLITRTARKVSVEAITFDQASWARFGETRLVLDGVAFRLAGASGNVSGDQGHRITLTFEDELATLMRRKKGPRRYRRGSVRRGWDTRASAIHNLVTDAIGAGAAGAGRFLTPNEDRPRPTKGDTPAAQRKARQKGLANWKRLKINSHPMTDTQRRFLEIALQVADQEGAGELATMAMLCSGVGESTWTNVVNSLGYGGVLQGQVAVRTPGAQNWFAPMGPNKRTEEQARSFLRGGRGFQGGGAMALARSHPDWSPGLIATTVEVSGRPGSYYDAWQDEARAILDSWGGAGGATGLGEVVVKQHPYFFTVGKGENFFDAAGRIAAEVRWRFWIDENTIWYAPDNWLFRSATTLQLSPTTQAVRGFDYTADVGIKIGELNVSVNIPRWVGSPAWRVEVDDMGPFNGLWLLARHEQDLITEESTLTLHRPAPELKEPASRTTTRIIPTGPILNEGDSLAVGTADKLHDLNPQVTTRAAAGRTSTEGLADLNAVDSLPSILIVQLGTNDSDLSTFTANVHAIKALPGVEHIYWVNISKPPTAVLDSALNEILDNNRGPNFTVIDWKHAVTSGKVNLPDGTHPDAAGYEYRAKLINGIAGPKKRTIRTPTAEISGSPRDIIDKIVLPIGRKHGLHCPDGSKLTPANNDAANARHSHLGSSSDHAGPPSVKWAADMSNGSSPTKAMDACSRELARVFGIPWPAAIFNYSSGTGIGIRSATNHGYRFQMIYRYSDAQAGNHFNHIHLGVRRV